MSKLFDMNHPIWRFMGKLVDLALLTGLWFLCSIPVVTIGASTAALYYVSLKLADDREGYVISSFFRAFRENLRQGIAVWLILLALGLFLGVDLYAYYHVDESIGKMIFCVFLILTVLYFMVMTYVFPLMARCAMTVKQIFLTAFVMALKNVGWSILMIVCGACLLALGLFVMAPLLALSVGLTAYVNSKIMNMLFAHYHLNLETEEKRTCYIQN